MNLPKLKPRQNTSEESADFPLMMFMSFFIGMIITGTPMATLGFLITSLIELQWQWKMLLGGTIPVMLAAIGSGIIWVYWRYVIRETDTLFPSLGGFIVLGMILSFFSGMFVAGSCFYKINSLI